jgi:hypothetical protein
MLEDLEDSVEGNVIPVLPSEPVLSPQAGAQLGHLQRSPQTPLGQLLHSSLFWAKGGGSKQQNILRTVSKP